MPKPNYAYEKRQRELEKKRKKEDKAQKKAAASTPPEDGMRPSQETADSEPAADTATPG
jgi:hypothetical protein